MNPYGDIGYDMRKRKANRLKEYDYSSPGYYFVTICVHSTQVKYNIFGVIDNGRMILNSAGETAQKSWFEIPDHFDDVEIDEFVIMPDHVHGIVVLNHPAGNRHAIVRDRHACPVRQRRQNEKLPVVIGSYKSAVSKIIHEAGEKSFAWQKSYHDRIIRDNEELKNVRQYIRDNPVKWEYE